MSFITFFMIFIFTLVKNSFAVQCNTNPCQLGGKFIPPNYNCIQLTTSTDVVFCTCPNSVGRINIPCRICDSINCGPGGVCFELPELKGIFHLCGCTNGTGMYAIPGPCPGPTSTTTSTITTTITTTTTTTLAPTSPPINCLNGGVYNVATATCICRTVFKGFQCETSIGQELCQSIICANEGICNPVPTANNGVDVQCWCLDGYSGSNCELIGMSGSCTSKVCQNGGICEEKRLGSSLFAYCQCQPGFSGQCCENRYFTCSHSGLFIDTINCNFGRYFECSDTVPIIRSCAKGLRFNSITMQCDLNGSCP